MKRIPGFLLLSVLFSCSQKLHPTSSKSLAQTGGQILEKLIIENTIHGKCGLTVMCFDLSTRDTISSKVFYSSVGGQGEIPGSLIDHLCTKINLNEGYYKLQITSFGHDTLNIDSLFLEKGKKINLKAGLHSIVYEHE